MNLQPALQPIRCVKTGKTVAAEALARWQQGQRVLTPAQVEGAVDWAAVDLQLLRWPALHRAGLAIALDDFGDHYSSL